MTTREQFVMDDSSLSGRIQMVWLRIKGAFRDGIGWCLEGIGAPAKLKVFEFVDPASNETVYLYTSKRFSVLCLGERRFYFDRVNGRFDGVSSPATDGVARRLKLGD